MNDWFIWVDVWGIYGAGLVFVIVNEFDDCTGEDVISGCAVAGIVFAFAAVFWTGLALIWMINFPVTLEAVESFDGFNLHVKIASYSACEFHTMIFDICKVTTPKNPWFSVCFHFFWSKIWIDITLEFETFLNNYLS